MGKLRGKGSMKTMNLYMMGDGKMIRKKVLGEKSTKIKNGCMSDIFMTMNTKEKANS